MTTIGNQLPASAFVSHREIRVVSSSSPPIELMSQTSPEVKLVLPKPGRTPNPRKLESLRVLAVPPGTDIAGWLLKSVLLVQLRRARKEWLAVTWLEGIGEYGTAETDDEAIADLVVSVGEYRASLEKREKKLGDSALRELAYLRRLIEPSTTK